MNESVITITVEEYKRLKKIADAKEERLKKLHETESAEYKRERVKKYYQENKKKSLQSVVKNIKIF
jgi:hypothetical protein